MTPRVQRLRDGLAALPTLPDAPRFSWTRRRTEIRERLLTDDPATFKTWPIICECLWTGETPDTVSEWREMSPRWRAAIDDPHNGTLVHQAYSLFRWEQVTGKRVEDLARICEFGGGYGEMARLCYRQGFKGIYCIFDFPELCLLQEYYLDNLDGVLTTPLPHIWNEQMNQCPDLVIALCSLSEVPIDVRERFMGAESAQSYLFRYQDTWNDVDNVSWFESFAKRNPAFSWTTFVVPYYQAHWYSIGERV